MPDQIDARMFVLALGVVEEAAILLHRIQTKRNKRVKGLSLLFACRLLTGFAQ